MRCSELRSVRERAGWPAYCLASLYENTKARPLQFKHVDSFTPAESPLPLRLDRLPRGFPARGVLASHS